MSGELSVRVVEDGEEVVWRQVSDLATAGPDDRVFVVAEDAAAIRFGDGVQGRRPPEDAAVLVGHYTEGVGRSGEVEIQVRLPGLPPRELPSLPGQIVQIMPAGGWSAVERAPGGERLVPLVAWALLGPYRPEYRDGRFPDESGPQSVRGLVVDRNRSVVVVDERAPGFGGYRGP